MALEASWQSIYRFRKVCKASNTRSERIVSCSFLYLRIKRLRLRFIPRKLARTQVGSKPLNPLRSIRESAQFLPTIDAQPDYQDAYFSCFGLKGRGSQQQARSLPDVLWNTILYSETEGRSMVFLNANHMRITGVHVATAALGCPFEHSSKASYSCRANRDLKRD